MPRIDCVRMLWRLLDQEITLSTARTAVCADVCLCDRARRM